jgi:GT2 family glycosyltransferase
VVATRDRRESLLRTLARLRDLPSAEAVIVVDNASRDGTAGAVRREAPWASVVRLSANLGAAGRTVGARLARTEYVAFCDDDSWWLPGAIPAACGHMDRFPGVGLVAARVLVGPRACTDPTSLAMARSPLPRGRSGGVPVLGFLACGAVVRRAAFLAVGGFEPRFGVGGEEQLLAIDLAAAGWELVYLPEVVVHHHPSPAGRDAPRRRRAQARNAVRCAWLRRPAGRALALSLAEARRGGGPAALGVAGIVRDAAWLARRRRVVAPWLEGRLRLLEESVAAARPAPARP